MLSRLLVQAVANGPKALMQIAEFIANLLISKIVGYWNDLASTGAPLFMRIILVAIAAFDFTMPGCLTSWTLAAAAGLIFGTTAFWGVASVAYFAQAGYLEGFVLTKFAPRMLRLWFAA